MLQVVLQQPGAFVARQAPPPEAAPGDALVRVRRVGVCGTDLHAFAGRQPFFEYPRVLGHELGVEIVSVPPNDRGLAVGDRCALEPYLACGRCRTCQVGRTNCCETLRVLGVHCDGGMQPLFAAPLALLHKSEKLSLDQLALVETLGIGAHAVERAIERGGLRPGGDALVVGAGPIGLAVTQFVLAAGARARVLDTSPSRRAFVARLGVETLATPDDRLADVVFDATGNRAAMEASLARVAFGGALVYVGIVKDVVALDDPLLHRREVTLLASRNSAGLFPKIIRQIEDGVIDTRPWITHRFALEDTPTAFGKLPGDPGLVKAMIEVEEG